MNADANKNFAQRSQCEKPWFTKWSWLSAFFILFSILVVSFFFHRIANTQVGVTTSQDQLSATLKKANTRTATQNNASKSEGNFSNFQAKSTPFELTPEVARERISLPAVTSDLKITKEMAEFLSLDSNQILRLENKIKATYEAAQKFASENLYLIEESQSQTIAIIDADPNAQALENELKNTITEITGHEKAEFLWRQASGRFQSDLGNFGKHYRIITVKPTKAPEGDNLPWYEFSTISVRENLFPSVHDLIQSNRHSDSSIAAFRGDFKSSEIPPFLKPVVGPAK